MDSCRATGEAIGDLTRFARIRYSVEYGLSFNETRAPKVSRRERSWICQPTVGP